MSTNRKSFAQQIVFSKANQFVVRVIVHVLDKGVFLFRAKVYEECCHEGKGLFGLRGRLNS